MDARAEMEAVMFRRLQPTFAVQLQEGDRADQLWKEPVSQRGMFRDGVIECVEP